MGALAGVNAQSKRDIQRVFKKLKELEPNLAKETRRRYRAAAGPVLADAKGRQPEKSGALKAGTRIQIRGGVTAIVSSAPHARISEFGGRRRVFGRDVWVDQPASPAIWPAMSDGRARFLNESRAALYAALKKAGYS